MYELIILGAGAAGMTASIYASRFKISHLIFGNKIGGQFVDAHIIENYPGFTSVEGLTLMEKFRAHVGSYGVNVREEKIGGIEKIKDQISNIKNINQEFPLPRDPAQASGVFNGEGFVLTTERGESIKTRAVILAMGAQHRALNVIGEESFLGRGVSYCATCDAPLFGGKVVAVVGGGNSAVTAAIHASQFASKVYLIHRRAEFDRADPLWIDSLNKKENVIKVLNTQVKEIFGRNGPKSTGLNWPSRPEGEAGMGNLGFDQVRGLVLSAEFNGSKVLPVDGVFIEIGLMPAVSLANQIGVATDSSGYIVTTGDLRTNVPGVFAAGDLVKQSDVPQLRQIVTSAGQGAVAAASVYAYLNNKLPGPDWG